MGELKEGDRAPGFALADRSGKTVRLSDFRGRQVVVYFYPRDDTPGCTTEACGFRDLYGAFEGKGAVVVGISPDSAASHDRFAEKLALPFVLLSDPDHAVAEAYGAWGEKKLYGKVSVGMLRSTFLVDGEGRVRRAWRKVKAAGHAEEVLSAL